MLFRFVVNLKFILIYKKVIYKYMMILTYTFIKFIVRYDPNGFKFKLLFDLNNLNLK